MNAHTTFVVQQYSPVTTIINDPSLLLYYIKHKLKEPLLLTTHIETTIHDVKQFVDTTLTLLGMSPSSCTQCIGMCPSSSCTQCIGMCPSSCTQCIGMCPSSCTQCIEMCPSSFTQCIEMSSSSSIES